MTRGERRNINKSKWFNKLRSIYKSKTWDWYRLVDKYAPNLKTFDGRTIYPKEWKDLMKTKDGVLYKNTRTKWKKEKLKSIPMDDIKMLHKRDLRNKLIPKEQLEELNQYIEDANDPFAFEKYCGSCDNFGNAEKCPFYGKVESQTIWTNIGCKKFWD